MLEKKPFINYDFKDGFEDDDDVQKPKDSKREIFTMSLNTKEMEQLKEDMQSLQQSKPSTAMKQMWQIARFVLHQSEMGYISRLLYNNMRRNVRIGINDVEPELSANVKLNQ